MVILKVLASINGIDILTVLTYEISKTGKKVERFRGSNSNPEKEIIPKAGMLPPDQRTSSDAFATFYLVILQPLRF